MDICYLNGLLGDRGQSGERALAAASPTPEKKTSIYFSLFLKTQTNKQTIHFISFSFQEEGENTYYIVVRE